MEKHKADCALNIAHECTCGAKKAATFRTPCCPSCKETEIVKNRPLTHGGGSSCPDCHAAPVEPSLEEIRTAVKDAFGVIGSHAPVVESWEAEFDKEFVNVGWHPQNKEHVMGFIHRLLAGEAENHFLIGMELGKKKARQQVLDEIQTEISEGFECFSDEIMLEKIIDSLRSKESKHE